MLKRVEIFDEDALEQVRIRRCNAAFVGKNIINIGRTVFGVEIGLILVEWLVSNVEEITDNRQRSGSFQAVFAVSLVMSVFKIEPREVLLKKLTISDLYQIWTSYSKSLKRATQLGYYQ